MAVPVVIGMVVGGVSQGVITLAITGSWGQAGQAFIGGAAEGGVAGFFWEVTASRVVVYGAAMVAEGAINMAMSAISAAGVTGPLPAGDALIITKSAGCTGGSGACEVSIISVADQARLDAATQAAHDQGMLDAEGESMSMWGTHDPTSTPRPNHVPKNKNY